MSPRRPLVRILAVLALTTAAALTLSGCFVIPLIDNRSPFDDPGGASRSETGRAAKAATKALEDVDTRDGQWEFIASTGSDNCEGACNLHLLVEIAPTAKTPIIRPTPSDTSPYASPSPTAGSSWSTTTRGVVVPTEVLRDVLVSVVPVAERYHVDVTVTGGYEQQDYDNEGDIADASRALFGEAPDQPAKDASFRLSKWGDAEVTAYTRRHTGVLKDMHLD